MVEFVTNLLEQYSPKIFIALWRLGDNLVGVLDVSVIYCFYCSRRIFLNFRDVFVCDKIISRYGNASAGNLNCNLCELKGVPSSPAVYLRIWLVLRFFSIVLSE